MIKLAIVGYGKMGKEIESVIDQAKFKLIGKYDIDNRIQDNLGEVPDVAIEFSTPKSAIDNIEFLASRKINIVCGTTGWYDKIDKVKEIIANNDTGFIYATNFSLGVNIFYQIVKSAAEIINKFQSYDVAVSEIHHNQKIDRPSGTALRITDLLIEGIKRKERIYATAGSAIDPGSIDVASTRVGSIFGIHKVILDSSADTITLEHSAKSRQGFAEGALLAAKFIHNLKGFYKFEEIFNKLT
jgi:4-hydroxy-tetrahydrodipicolinate reductase